MTVPRLPGMPDGVTHDRLAQLCEHPITAERKPGCSALSDGSGVQDRRTVASIIYATLHVKHYWTFLESIGLLGTYTRLRQCLRLGPLL